MTTECNQATFEFHGLLHRKVKARIDGGKITSDAGVLLLREVEKRTDLIAGLTECFTDHRDQRLIEHTVKELLGQRIYGLCLGYEDLNDHDQLRADPMLAIAVDKADPGEPTAGRGQGKGAGGQVYAEPAGTHRGPGRWAGTIQEDCHGWGHDRPLDGGCFPGGPRIGARGDCAGSGPQCPKGLSTP